ncbi:60S acidic ribosomal protein P1-A [Candida viswanathii]|uniref:60S acidic ribosomal protein P1-A n=1 Tax=Candida viswanathii TaxID=5486 RepID=A0A367XQY6_9ASCO|nr:60S acidic ribosomal protein P1-A [Candida viswanathii]RCK61012.1 60S acidic ribosomal protein P1-A [Candida viswanathii]
MSTESALSYAALILADSDIEITSEKLLALVTKANVEVEGIWADLFAKALEGKDLKEFFFNFSAAPAAAAGAAGAGAAGAAAEEAAEEEKEEEAKEESDDDMGFGLFD